MTSSDPLDLVRAANPVASLKLSRQESHRAEELLARLLSARHGDPDGATASGTSRWIRRPVIIATAAATAFVAASGVAVAEGISPFDSLAALVGISSANHAAAPADALDPRSLEMIKSWNDLGTQLARQSGAPPRLVEPETARLISQFPSGRRFYVMTTTTSDLCVLVTPASDSHDGPSLSCGNPLSQTKPTTVETQDLVSNGPNPTPPFTYGVARDGVTAVSFTIASGSEETVPVVRNVWAYEGPNGALDSVTVRYADGTTQRVPH